jgi:hypothetical protein
MSRPDCSSSANAYELSQRLLLPICSTRLRFGANIPTDDRRDSRRIRIIPSQRIYSMGTGLTDGSRGQNLSTGLPD